MTGEEFDALIWLIIFWAVVGGGVGAAIGGGKDRGTEGFWLGLGLGVIGWIIVAVMEPSADEQRRRQMAAAEQNAYLAARYAHGPTALSRPIDPEKRCPYCAERIQAAAVICRFCGRPLPAHASPIEALSHEVTTWQPSAPPPGGQWSTVEPGRAVVEKSPAPGGPRAAAPSYAPRRRSPWSWLLSLLLVALLLGLVWAIVNDRPGEAGGPVDVAQEQLPAPTAAPRPPPPPTLDPLIQAAMDMREELAYEGFGRFRLELGATFTTVGVIGETVCVEMTATNVGSRDAMFPGFTVILVKPSGSYASSSFLMDGSNDLRIVPMSVPGAATPGKMCWLTDGERGTFTVKYDPGNDLAQTWTFDVT